MSWLSWQTCLQDFPGSAIFTWRALNGGHITCPWQKSCSDRSCFVVMCSDNISQYSDYILTFGNSPKDDQIVWAWSIMVCFFQTKPRLVWIDPSLWPKAPKFIYQFSLSAWALFIPFWWMAFTSSSAEGGSFHTSRSHHKCNIIQAWVTKYQELEGTHKF